jgi:SAM-dependent methyltransferase
MTEQLRARPDVHYDEMVGSTGLSTGERDTSAWFVEHYKDAADQIIDFLAGDGISFTGQRVADVGCGDGIIDLGVVHKAEPARLVGFDVVPTDPEWLLERARAEGVCDELPSSLEFRTCGTRTLPADDDAFDFVFTWSAFEHVEDPIAVFREIHRVLRPGGILMLQIWPLYHSEHGAHLWQCIPDRFAHLLRPAEDIKADVRATTRYPRDVIEEFLEVFDTLNRVTLEDLQRALLAASLRVAKLELQSESVHIPPELARHPLSQLGISGVKLLAVPG